MCRLVISMVSRLRLKRLSFMPDRAGCTCEQNDELIERGCCRCFCILGDWWKRVWDSFRYFNWAVSRKISRRQSHWFDRNTSTTNIMAEQWLGYMPIQACWPCGLYHSWFFSLDYERLPIGHENRRAKRYRSYLISRFGEERAFSFYDYRSHVEC